MASKANDINDTINILSKLDNGHDFINRSGNYKDQARLALLSLLSKNYKINSGDVTTEIGSLLGQLTGNGVTSMTTNYEPTVESYIKTKLNYQTQEISIQTILKAHENWSSKGKDARPERPAQWIKVIGHRDQAQKEIDEPKMPADMINIPIANNIMQTTTNGRSLKIYWDSSDTAIPEWKLWTGASPRILSDFVLKYFFPTLKDIGRGSWVFDAGSGAIGKIFTSLPQIASVINPLVVSDSAPSSLKKLGKGRNIFCFPHNSNIEVAGDSVPAYKVEANVLTKQNSTILFKSGISPIYSEIYYISPNPKVPYDENNFNLFRIVIKCNFVNLDDGATINTISKIVDFTDSNNSGPSVLYLSQLINAIRTSAKQNIYANVKSIAPTRKSILSISNQIADIIKWAKANLGIADASADNSDYNKLKLWLCGLLFDIKRCGDWEQVRSCGVCADSCPDTGGVVMLGTIDRLCGVYSFLQDQPGAFHSSGSSDSTDATDESSPANTGVSPSAWNISLVRAPKNINPNVMKAVEYRDFSKKMITLCNCLLAYNTAEANSSSSMKSSLNDLYSILSLYKNQTSPRITIEGSDNNSSSIIARLSLYDLYIKVVGYMQSLDICKVADSELENIISIKEKCEAHVFDFSQKIKGPPQELPAFVEKIGTYINYPRRVAGGSITAYYQSKESAPDIFRNICLELGFSYNEIDVMIKEGKPKTNVSRDIYNSYHPSGNAHEFFHSDPEEEVVVDSQYNINSNFKPLNDTVFNALNFIELQKSINSIQEKVKEVRDRMVPHVGPAHTLCTAQDLTTVKGHIKIYFSNVFEMINRFQKSNSKFNKSLKRCYNNLQYEIKEVIILSTQKMINETLNTLWPPSERIPIKVKGEATPRRTIIQMCTYANNVLAFFENLDETIKCDLLKKSAIFSDVSMSGGTGDSGPLMLPQTCSMAGGSLKLKQKGGNTPLGAFNFYCDTVLSNVLGQISAQLNAFIHHNFTPSDEWNSLKNYLLNNPKAISFISDLYINAYNAFYKSFDHSPQISGRDSVSEMITKLRALYEIFPPAPSSTGEWLDVLIAKKAAQIRHLKKKGGNWGAEVVKMEALREQLALHIQSLSSQLQSIKYVIALSIVSSLYAPSEQELQSSIIDYYDMQKNYATPADVPNIDIRKQQTINKIINQEFVDTQSLIDVSAQGEPINLQLIKYKIPVTFVNSPYYSSLYKKDSRFGLAQYRITPGNFNSVVRITMKLFSNTNAAPGDSYIYLFLEDLRNSQDYSGYIEGKSTDDLPPPDASSGASETADVEMSDAAAGPDPAVAPPDASSGASETADVEMSDAAAGPAPAVAPAAALVAPAVAPAAALVAPAVAPPDASSGASETKEADVEMSDAAAGPAPAVAPAVAPAAALVAPAVAPAAALVAPAVAPAAALVAPAAAPAVAPAADSVAEAAPSSDEDKEMHSQPETQPSSPHNYIDFESSDEEPSGYDEEKTQDPAAAASEVQPPNMANTTIPKPQAPSSASNRHRNQKRPRVYADKSLKMTNPAANKTQRVSLFGKGGRRKNKLTKRKHKNGKKAKKAKKGKNRTKKRKKKHKYTRKKRKHKIKKKK